MKVFPKKLLSAIQNARRDGKKYLPPKRGNHQATGIVWLSRVDSGRVDPVGIRTPIPVKFCAHGMTDPMTALPRCIVRRYLERALIAIRRSRGLRPIFFTDNPGIT